MSIEDQDKDSEHTNDRPRYKGSMSDNKQCPNDECDGFMIGEEGCFKCMFCGETTGC